MLLASKLDNTKNFDQTRPLQWHSLVLCAPGGDNSCPCLLWIWLHLRNSIFRSFYEKKPFELLYHDQQTKLQFKCDEERKSYLLNKFTSVLRMSWIILIQYIIINLMVKKSYSLICIYCIHQTILETRVTRVGERWMVTSKMQTFATVNSCYKYMWSRKENIVFFLISFLCVTFHNTHITIIKLLFLCGLHTIWKGQPLRSGKKHSKCQVEIWFCTQ